VLSKNLHRRHLDSSQRAMVAAKIAGMKQGARSDLSPIGEKSQADAADALNVGKRSVERAREVSEDGIPELIAAVESGEVSVSAAAEVASLPDDEQRAAGRKEKAPGALVASRGLGWLYGLVRRWRAPPCGLAFLSSSRATGTRYGIARNRGSIGHRREGSRSGCVRRPCTPSRQRMDRPNALLFLTWLFSKRNFFRLKMPESRAMPCPALP